MKAWQLWELAVLWVVAAIVLLALVAFDLQRARNVALPFSRPVTMRQLLASVLALRRIVPIAVGAILGIPVLVVGVTVWWIATRF
jgi:hypothetical protein